MNSSDSTRRSAPSARARARAARALAALPVTSPTVGFNWASVIENWALYWVMKQWCLAHGQPAIAWFRSHPCAAILKSRRDRHRLDLAGALLLEQFGDQEGHVDRLLGIEPGIADRVVAVVEILVGDGARAADAFGHVLAGHFQMYAAGMGAFRRMDGEERLHLGQH